MILPILKIPTPSLRNRSRELTREDLATTEIQTLIDNMIPTMYDDDGIGLAAPQVGHNVRIIVIGKAADKHLKDDLVLVNPVFEKTSKKTNTDLEGCLSVPGKIGTVRRFSSISVQALDRFGTPLSFMANKYFARVIQHETDHLDGILYIDRAYDIEDDDRI